MLNMISVLLGTKNIVSLRYTAHRYQRPKPTEACASILTSTLQESA